MNHTKMQIRTVFQSSMTGLLVVMLIILGACASPPQKETLGLQISATADVNPDMQGRPSPVILHIMELNSVDQFNGLDYMSLTDPSGAGLGVALLSRKQEILQPGASRQLPLELNPQTTVIGLVAGYRDIDNATWRTSVPITQGVSKGLNIILNQQQIVTAVSN